MPFLSTMRLRDTGLPLLETGDMDINYILRREQVSLYNASVASSAPARLVHEKLAIAYGQILTESGFPHRDVALAYVGPVTAAENDRWEDDGGPAARPAASSIKAGPAVGEPAWSTPASRRVSSNDVKSERLTLALRQPVPDQITDLARELSRDGITQVPADHFEVNGFRYSNARDAIAEARRHPRPAVIPHGLRETSDFEARR